MQSADPRAQDNADLQGRAAERHQIIGGVRPVKNPLRAGARSRHHRGRGILGAELVAIPLSGNHP